MQPSGDFSLNGAGGDAATFKFVDGHTGSANGHINGYVKNHADNRTNGNANGSKASPEPVAVCGLAMRLPGGIRDAEAFWDVLHNGIDTRAPVPSDRYNINGFNDSLGKKGAIKTQYGYFLNEDLASLDTSFFTMTKTELERADPQQRQLLEVTRECFESAGEVNYGGKLIGCYVGTFGEDWLQMSAKEDQHFGGYIMTGHGDLMIANRVSYEYNLQGPSMVIKTGCSASLVALHEACRALQSGDCTGAIVAGTNLIMGPTTTAAMTQEGIISPEGSCKTFDAAADGFARGEAVTAVYIKRLVDALRDGNPVRAVIRNTATNSDGKSQGLMTPNGKAHEMLMRKVYLDAGLDPRNTAFVECHGTGTPTGDPIETTAVGNVFGERGVFIGSVKPNVGHSEGASGITSLIKAVLALKNRTIPPNIKFTKPNPKIPFNEKHLKVPVIATPWPIDRAMRISINSFGIGGTNAHVILDSASEFQPEPSGMNELLKNTPRLVVFSANTQDALRRQVSNYQEYIKLHPECLLDLAYTLSIRREQLPYRAFSVVLDGSITNISSFTKVSGTVPGVVMICSGQGAQWPEMGRELIQTDHKFRDDIRAMDKILQTLNYPPEWRIEDELQKPTETSQIHRAELAQPLCTAIQIALVNTFLRCGVRPEAVIGHSSGEIVAAYASGALSFSETLIAAYYRGYVTKTQTLEGGMAAIGLGASTASTFLRDGVVIACENSPSSTTISGDLDQLKSVQAAIQKDQPDVLVRRLKVDMAYHSHHMKSLGSQYRDLLEDEIQKRNLVRRNPEVPFFSSVTKNVIKDSTSLDPGYWESNLTSPVLFNTAVSNLLRHQKNNIFLEIGPHSTLAGPLRQICSEAGSTCLYVPAMLRNRDCAETLASAFGQLYQQGVPIDFETLVPGGRVLPNLPAYPWAHSASYWYESRVSKEWRFRKFGHHSLLGLLIHNTTAIGPCWRNVLHVEDEPWLYDHKVQNDVVFPFAGYAAMAGEAVRQVTGVEAGYSLRHVMVHTALVLIDSKPVEMITTLRPYRLTDSTDSDWFDFVVSSHSGSTWIKNCEGQVKPRQVGIPGSSKIETYPRKIIPSKWYEVMARIGFVYGSEFQGLTAISSSTTDHVAVGEITNPKTHQEAPYLFHPTAIDLCLQTLLVAMVNGIGRNFAKVAVPTRIEELEISRSSLKMDVKAWKSTGSGALGVDCTADGKTVLRIRGVHLDPMEDEGILTTSDRYAGARLEWCPDFDFLDVSLLFKPPISTAEETILQEEIVLLCMLDSAERLRGLVTEEPHLAKYRNWLERQVRQAEEGSYQLVEDARHYVKFPRADRLEMIKERYSRLSKMPSKAALATGAMRICENCEAIFMGQGNTLDFLMQDDILTEIYNAISFGHGDFVRMLSHAKPDLRILEVGAGTGGTTEMILHDLVDSTGYPAYSLYTFTDISAGFFPQARERFSYASNMEYRVFDISLDPFKQGFEAQSYDLILAPNVVHATPSLQETLLNLQPLLRPHGYLVLTELCAVARTPNYIFGNFSGWWLGEPDGRPDEPYVSVDRWDRELKASGFTGVDTAVYDAEEPYQYCAAIVTQPKPITDGISETRSVTVLCDRPNEGISQRLINDLRQDGFVVYISGLGELPRQGQDIVSTLDLESNFFENISEERFSSFQSVLRHQKSQKILWLTAPSQILCKDPRAAQTIGMSRTIRSELAIPFATLEIDQTETDFSNLVMQVFKKVQSREDTENLTPDREYAVDKGVIKIGRYHPFSFQQELGNEGAVSSGHVKTLEIGKPGLLETLRWMGDSRLGDLEDDQVEIDARAIGLNFKDIILAMGIVSSGFDNVPLGLETAGFVRRVGSNVKSLSVGNRVFALAPHGCITTNAILPAPLCVKIPDDLSFEEAATMPICFVTALRSLVDIGQLQKGQTVLIHSACGGIGHAAIQVCRMIGAEIFATVGNTQKAQYLVDTFDIPRNHIFNSRDVSFVSDLIHETGGRGVDIVLNSLSGELLHASWKCVAEFGKLIELGKRDLAGFGRLDMETFLTNRSYCCVDISHLTQHKPEKMGLMLERCLEMYRQGHIHPIRPVKIFEASEIEESFRHLQAGNHIGKVVIQMPEDASKIASSPRARVLALDPEAAYLLVGGLGGLGKSIAIWMVEREARFLVFLSRNAGLSDEDKAFLKELESMGCSVSAIAGEVQAMEDVQRTISKASRPIKGVIQLAMVLRDAPIVDMSHADWMAAIVPKVDGTWNLHNAFLAHSLDFFLLASSLVTVVDQPGQANYNAANTFLEAFCQYRHGLGLSASVLNICPIEGVGFVAENPAAKKNMKAQGLYFLGEKEFLDYLELSIFSSYPPEIAESSPNPFAPWKNTSQLVMGLKSELHLDDPKNRTNWRRDRRMGVYHNVKDTTTGSAAGNANELKNFLARAADDPDILSEKTSAERLAREIGQKVYSFMLKPQEEVDISASLTQIGLDSLMAIELRRWWKQAFGLQISVLEIMGSGTLEELGRMAVDGVRRKLKGDDDEGEKEGK